ncbi:alpha,alpha-trehalase TreF [Pseudobacter ginsenosidimutans]|uniref:Alpha,alpha-trehalase n=1 Tax=Pseudobacter ginsenosidimutans TaxID=661488 RepID=A0A4Q7MTH8_9BACT|nr:alpha,alpha-trehalase TreF [Pseudobacter ginsenosidimutans]QEC41077.1 alpha,alpha-trehalase TreF [Pseudobacter ginsenosidimutans]RZS72166.1 alpha,alpha-trehalase [Pseudobacter ginsenosidimutans]
MKRSVLILFFSSFIAAVCAQPVSPDKLYGELFREIQMKKVFEDGKTFVDCIPKRSPAAIMHDYTKAKGKNFDLKKFVTDNFEPPYTPQLNYIQQEKDIMAHITNVWSLLRREPDNPSEGSSLLPLPYPYIVPGGRFREIYYWDAYFTMLGLKETEQTALVRNMVDNFAYLINTYGHIPNGNRSYYLSRSQPPFFALMVDLLAEIQSDTVYASFLPTLEKEYDFWMAGAAKLKPGEAHRRVVRMPDGNLMNRYWDDQNTPRPESYREDVETAKKAKGNKATLYRNLRAGAESGMDFSSRWLADGKNLHTIQTTNYIPVDLNTLIYKLELGISRGKQLTGQDSLAQEFRKKADRRIIAIDKYCWNKNQNFYTDYNFVTKKVSNMITPAGMYPFCLFNRKLDYMSLLARKAAIVVRTNLLKDGGVLTTANNTGQQWDAPNGWAPLQYMTVWGFQRCGQRELAREIAQKWTILNTDVYKRTGRLMEKYNVVDTKLEAGGGEYPGQDGFGWTNGVFLKLVSMYLPK